MRTIDRIIEVKVRGHLLTKDNRNAGVQYEANVTKLRIDFDEGWDGYAKTVTFWNALMANPVKRVLTVDALEDIYVSPRIYIIPIPGEAMDEAGDMTFVIDGYADGQRKRSLSDTLWVKEAPMEQEAGEPVDPTPTQAEQMQGQLDQIIQTIADSMTAARDSQSWAEYSQGQASAATSSAQYAQEMATYSYNVKEEAVTAKDAAQEAQRAAEQARDDAREIAGADFATETYVNTKVNQTELKAYEYTDTTVSNEMSKVNAELATVARAKTGGEIDQRLQNRIEKTGDKMTGILEFDTPGLFSAFQKKRLIGDTTYLVRLGIGSYGTGGNISLRLVTVAADGTETGAGQFDIDANGLTWVTPGGLRKTVAHSGNIGVLTASVE